MKLTPGGMKDSYILSRTVPAAEGYSISGTVEEDVTTLTGDEINDILNQALALGFGPASTRSAKKQAAPPADTPSA